MYFTQEDYRCIQNWLQRHAVKDTEIPLTDEIHSNKDSLVIVQNNKNYRIGAIRFLSTVIDNAELNSLSLKTLNADLANVKKLIVESFETKGELIDGYGNNLNDTTEAAKGWSIKQIEPTSEETNVVAKYALTDYNGEYKGDFIKIYKNGDTFVADVYSGTIDDTVDNKTGIPNKKPITESNKALCVILHNGVDSYTISHIPSNTFIDFNFLKVWTGSNAISKLGTIAEGVWEGTPIADAFIASASKWNAKQDALTDTDGSYGQRIKTIESKIPADTTSENPLTNKEFVNSSIATNTATFRGTYTNVNQFPLTGVDDNDYVFLKVMDTEEPTQVLRYDRYKWNGTGWTFEYSLNNSSFTSEQWTAINSGITPELIETFNNKQNLISDLDEIRDNANKGAIAYSWGEHISTFNEFKWNEDHTAIYIGDENNPISFYAYGSISAGGFNNTSGTGGGTVIGIKIGDSDPITPIDGILNVPSDVISRSLGLKALAFKDILLATDIPTLDISKINGLQSVLNAFNAHIDNTIIHITADERTAWNKIASLFGIDEEGDIYLKPDTNGRDRGFYTSSFISSGGKNDTPGAGSGTVTGIKIGDEDIITPVNGILNIPPYPTTTSLGLKALAFKDSLSVSEVVGLQSALSNKQDVLGYTPVNKAGDTMSGSLTLGIRGVTVGEYNLFIHRGHTTTALGANNIGSWMLNVNSSNETSIIYLTNSGLTFTSNYNTSQASTYTIYHSGNLTASVIGSLGTLSNNISGNAATATNADTLDGFHISSVVHNQDVADADTMINSVAQYVSVDVNAYHVPFVGGELLSFGNEWYSAQLYISHFSNRAAIRGMNYGSWYNWRELAFLDSNVASATKLATPRTIWGRSFDGTGDVSGELTGVSGITFTSNGTKYSSYGNPKLGDNADDWTIYSKDSVALLQVKSNGNVGIGTNKPAYRLDVIGQARVTSNFYAPVHLINSTGTSCLIIGSSYTSALSDNDVVLDVNSGSNHLWVRTNTMNIGSSLTTGYKLHVAGNIFATGAITAGQASDARLKSNIVTALNACGILRSLRGVEFDWNAIATENCKDLTGHDVGLIAQEVESLIPSAIGTIWGEYKRLDYTKITPYLVEGWKAHDEEIQRLKTKIKQLEERIYGLEKQ